MAAILIVDDDKTFLLSVVEGLQTHDASYQVFPAGNGKEAVDILNNYRVDLVVTDLKMPEMDGFELLAYISQHYKEMPVIVITAFGTPEIERGLQKIYSFQYLEKPLDINILETKISEGLKAKLAGYVKGISLSSFLQIISMEGESCTLTIRSNNRVGQLFFDSGMLVDAVYESKVGVDAAYEIAVWENVEIEIDKVHNKSEQKIEISLQHLLVEAHRRIDENKKKQGLVNQENIQQDNNRDNDQVINRDNREQKENTMNIKKLQEAIKTLKDDLGDGLIAADIYSIVDGQSIVGYNSQPKACALFNRMTLQMNKTLKDSGFPMLGRYYLLDMADKKRVLVIPLGDYQWGILVDGVTTQLGLLLNIALPKAIDAFEEALIQ